MASNVPNRAQIHLPSWLWGASIEGYLQAAWLASEAPAAQPPIWVRANENNGDHKRTGLVTAIVIAGPSAPAFGFFDPLDRLDRDALQQLNQAAIPPELPGVIDEAYARVQTGGLTEGLWLHQLQTMLAPPGTAGATVRSIHEDLANLRFEGDGEIVLPDNGVVVIHSAPALLHRTQLPAVLLRLEHDDVLRNADVSGAAAAHAKGDLVFASSHGLNSGLLLLDAYLAPLFGALTPFVWAIPATRPSGTVIYTLGRAISGTKGEAAELLQLLPGRGAQESVPSPTLPTAAANAAVVWRARRLDKLLSIASDPAVFSDTQSKYLPSKHLHALLSIDQLFRRVASIQRSHRDTDARRVLLFTVLDTLERLSSRSLTTMCTLSFAEQTLARLQRALPSDAGAVLLPAAARSVLALRAVQEGFYLLRQRGETHLHLPKADGVTEVVEPEAAAAEYIRVLRNATHGHGSNRDEARARTNALLAQHDGELPHDLALLGYLYLLELLSNPSALRRTLYRGGLP